MSVPILCSFIGGEFRPPLGDLVDSTNPSDSRDVVARFGAGSADQLLEAVSVARTAQVQWAAKTGGARADHLVKWAEAIASRQEEVGQAICREVGKPIAEARGEAARAVAILRYFAGEAVRPIGDVIPAQVGGALQFSVRVPLGVVGLITPWNFPIAIPLWKAAPALALGNAVVLKPAEAASACAHLLAETAKAAGIPDGVFNIVMGTGSIVGEALTGLADLDAISFTGSAAIGKRVAEAAAGRNIKFQTEMGGKNVAIVLDDADLKLAATLVASGAMRYGGQKCTATSRAIVVRSQMDPFLSLLREEIARLALGPVTDPSAAIGPVISQEAKNRIEAAIRAAGEPYLSVPIPDGLSAGNYVSPTVFRDINASSQIVQEEIFGPVLAVLAAEDLDHALALANDTPFGLSASLFTKDIASALQYVHRIEAGMVRVNSDTTGVDPHAPFGGMKGSSSGTREQGPAARDFYSEVKTVQINRG